MGADLQYLLRSLDPVHGREPVIHQDQVGLWIAPVKVQHRIIAIMGDETDGDLMDIKQPEQDVDQLFFILHDSQSGIATAIFHQLTQTTSLITAQ
jgi:hypothetical protein